MNGSSLAGHEGGGTLDDLPTGLESQATAALIKPERAAKRTASVIGKSQAATVGKKAARATSPKPTGPNAISVAIDIGWTMAVLFGRQPVLDRLDDRLPTEHELPPDQRIQLETARANSLLARLGTLLPEDASLKPGVPQIGVTVDSAAGIGPIKQPRDDADPSAGTSLAMWRSELEKANFDILEWLGCAGREFSLAYQLGRSLRDTASPPIRSTPGTGEALTDLANIQKKVADNARRESVLLAARQKEVVARAKAITAQRQRTGPTGTQLPGDEIESPEAQAQRELDVRDALTSQLSRSRVAKLQEWLATLAPHLPADAAAIVSASIGRWCDLVTTVCVRDTPGKLRRFRRPSQWLARSSGSPSRFKLPSALDIAAELCVSLLPQGDTWLNLLVGAESSQGLLTPEGFVAAGEAALSRTARIMRKIVYHYWFALLVIAAALAGILYFAAQDLGGAGKLWTQIAAVAGALGVTTRGIGSAMAELSKDAEKPIFGLEKVDAMAWAITTFPAELKLDSAGVHALRRSGIPGSSPLGRI